MKRKEIHFVIDSKGDVKTTVKGLSGMGCDMLLQPFKKLGRVIGKDLTSEYYEVNEAHTVVYGNRKRDDS